MRIAAFATLALTVLAVPALAQTAPPAAPAAKPKPPAVAAPARPATQTPADTANAMTPAERLAIQSDLAWVGLYNGVIDGAASERMITAIKAFQKDRGAKDTGVLNPQERGALSDTAKKLQANVGWKTVTDPASGARIGLPGKLTPQQSAEADGLRWASTTGTIQIQYARRSEAGATTAKLAEAERKANGRKLDYSAVKPDFYVLAGTQGLKKFYLRGQLRDGEVRTLTILYDQATEGTMTPIVVAMSSAFNPFPAGVQATPAPRRNVEYSTGIVVSADGVVLADRTATDGCVAIVVAGYGNADRVNEKAAGDLALLRLYGARGLQPLALGNAAAKPAVDVVGIADPQSQGGGNAVTIAKAQAAPGASDEATLTPAPAIGFSGAAARDADGQFAGVAVLKTVMVAAAPPAPAATPAPVAPTTAVPPPAPVAVPVPQAMLVRADAVRALLKRHGVENTGGQADAKASVVRVICVRK